MTSEHRFEVAVPRELVESIARRVVALLEHSTTSAATPWLDFMGAAEYLAMSPAALRALVKRHRIPVHRLENGRLRFRRDELDEWVLSDATGLAE